MRPFSEQTGVGRLIEVLRWIGVLPAAVLGSFLTRLSIVALLQIAGFGGGNLGDSNVAYALRVFLYYVPRESAFVIAGAMMAPRYPKATSFVLALLGFFLSLMTHVLGQHLAENHVGIVNYTHFLAESAGLVAGAAGIFWQVGRSRRTCKSELKPDV